MGSCSTASPTCRRSWRPYPWCKRCAGGRPGNLIVIINGCDLAADWPHIHGRGPDDNRFTTMVGHLAGLCGGTIYAAAPPWRYDADGYRHRRACLPSRDAYRPLGFAQRPDGRTGGQYHRRSLPTYAVGLRSASVIGHELSHNISATAICSTAQSFSPCNGPSLRDTG